MIFVLAVAIAAVCGCQMGYYTQAAKGQYQLVVHKQSIPNLLAKPETPAPLKTQLQLLHDLLAFALTDLKLPVDGLYGKYVDVGRPFVVWNVEAAPEFSLEPKNWWYPLVGTLEYRGYFSEASANKYADQLRRQGFDVFVGGVEAYSTLGWFKDPALNTFIFDPEPDLAELIFHELGHQQLFVSGDEDFNEAFATTVGQEGTRRWLRTRRDPAALDQYQTELIRTEQFAKLVAATRQKLAQLYGDETTDDGRIKSAGKKSALADAQMRREKQRILDDLRQDYARLKAQWSGDTYYDGWFAHEVNNAKLNSVAAYYDFVPGFERLLYENGGDLPKFYEAAAQLAKLSKKDRHETLITKGRAEISMGRHPSFTSRQETVNSRSVLGN